MKYSFGMAAIIITSCNRLPEKKLEAEIMNTNSLMKSKTIEQKNSIIINGPTADNSSNAFDWAGTYAGEISCADSLLIQGNLYTRKAGRTCS